MTIQEAINTVAKCLQSQIDESILKITLMAENFTPQRADTIILWAKQLNAKDG